MVNGHSTSQENGGAMGMRSGINKMRVESMQNIHE